MTLTDAKINAEYVITKVKGEGHAKRRLLDMGFAPGSRVVVLGIAPFGETVLVMIRGIEVALRKNATDCISVEVKQ